MSAFPAVSPTLVVAGEASVSTPVAPTPTPVPVPTSEPPTFEQIMKVRRVYAKDLADARTRKDQINVIALEGGIAALDAYLEDNLENQAYKWAQDFLTSWSKVSRASVTLTKITRGLTNKLYEIKTSDPTIVPNKVLLRLYGHGAALDRVTDCFVAAILGERGISTQLYGQFRDGRLEQYLEHERCVYPIDYQRCPGIVNVIAKGLARLHARDVPVSKTPALQLQLDDWLSRLDTLSFAGRKAAKFARIMAEDPKALVAEMYRVAADCPSPLVFAHNDLQPENILLTFKQHTESVSPLDLLVDKEMAAQLEVNLPEGCALNIRLIDFEYGGYNTRGYDLANTILEYVFAYSGCNSPPYFSYKPDLYPSVSVIRGFMESYCEELEKLEGAPAGTYKNTKYVNGLIYEMTCHALGPNIMWAVWGVLQSYGSTIQFDYLEFALARLDLYKRIHSSLPGLKKELDLE